MGYRFANWITFVCIERFLWQFGISFISYKEAMAESKYSIAKLNVYNHFNRIYKIQMILTEKGVWKVVSENLPDPVTSAWMENDQKARATIALYVDVGQIQHIRDCDTARAAWMSYKEFHEKGSPGNRVYIWRSIMRFQLN